MAEHKHAIKMHEKDLICQKKKRRSYSILDAGQEHPCGTYVQVRIGSVFLQGQVTNENSVIFTLNFLSS